jgi:hypothetical protein
MAGKHLLTMKKRTILLVASILAALFFVPVASVDIDTCPS